MELTQEELKNVTAHIQTAISLIPYRELVEGIVNDPDVYITMMETSYEEYREESKTLTPGATLLSAKAFDTLQRAIRIISSDTTMAKYYLTVMDVAGKYPVAV